MFSTILYIDIAIQNPIKTRMSPKINGGLFSAVGCRLIEKKERIKNEIYKSEIKI